MNSGPKAADVALRRELLSWYDQNRRDLPWRKSPDPYRVWISEIMLQQTRVAAVLPKYESFLRRFPSVQKLAAARQASVLAQWSGLGYYRRARNLHAAAKIVAREGKFPTTSQGWRALPGIGRYSAAAIASIAFNEPVAVVDGNVERVLQRILQRPCTQSQAWQAAEDLLDTERPGDFNQAMMELGATICIPGRPLCHQCPIRAFCRTRGRGTAVRKQLTQRKRQLSYVLLTRNDSVLLVQRPRHASLMPGMWELPSANGTNRRHTLLFSASHSITNTDYAVSVLAGPVPRKKGTWFKVSRLNAIPLTGVARKILRKARIIL